MEDGIHASKNLYTKFLVSSLGLDLVRRRRAPSRRPRRAARGPRQRGRVSIQKPLFSATSRVKET